MTKNEPGAVPQKIRAFVTTPIRSRPLRSNSAWILSSPVDDLSPMFEARDVATDTQLSQAELAWLGARFEEYQDFLQYLQDH